MKRPLYLINVWVYKEEQQEESFRPLEIIDREGRGYEDFYRFYVVPRKGDVICIADIYYRVLEVQFEGHKKSFAHPTFYSEGMIFVKIIGDRDAYRKLLLSQAKTA